MKQTMHRCVRTVMCGLTASLVMGLCIGGGCPMDGNLNLNLNLNLNSNSNANANANGNDNGSTMVSVRDFATNTAGASGLAVRPSDGGVFLVNPDGLFGPVTEGQNVSTLTPFGATNLADADLFDQPQTAFVLTITGAGEFWIGSGCCSTLAVVPPGGGDAQPFVGLIGDGTNPNLLIMPETLAVVPSTFVGPQIMPTNILVGAETTFSRLAAIDVDARTAISVDNPTLDDPDGGLNRNAHHLAFGPAGMLFSSRGTVSATTSGIQTIAPDGSPAPLAGTLNVAAHTFIVLDNGDLLIDGLFREGASSGETFAGLFFWSAATQTIVPGFEFDRDDVSEDDELVRRPDGTFLLAQPKLNRVIVVEDLR